MRIKRGMRISEGQIIRAVLYLEEVQINWVRLYFISGMYPVCILRCQGGGPGADAGVELLAALVGGYGSTLHHIQGGRLQTHIEGLLNLRLGPVIQDNHQFIHS